MIYKFKRKQFLRSTQSGDIYIVAKKFFSKTNKKYYYILYNFNKKRYKSVPVKEVHSRYIKDKVGKLLYGKI